MILALDLGSTSFKAAVYDAALRPLGVGSAPLPHRFAPGGVAEIEVAVAETAFADAVRAALASAAVPAARLRALGLDSQAQTFTTRAPDGRARHAFISWQDTRAQAACAALKADPAYADFARHCSFGEPLAALHVCQLRHQRDTAPGRRAAGDLVLHLPTWFVLLLTGRAVLDDNLAAMSGLYSLVAHDWWDAALAFAGVTRAQLPALVPVGSIAARTGDGAARLGLPAGLPVVLAGNDQTAGAYGAQVAERRAVLLTLGTAQVVYAAAPALATPVPALIRGPYPGGLAYRMTADSCGGAIINWARTVVAGGADAAAFFRLAAQAEPGCRGLTFDADLPAGAGAWRGLGLHHTPADLARAVVEALVARLATQVRALGLPPGDARYLVAGGGSQSPFWVGLLAAALGAPLEPADADPLRGAARLAVTALPAA